MRSVEAGAVAAQAFAVSSNKKATTYRGDMAAPGVGARIIARALGPSIADVGRHRCETGMGERRRSACQAMKPLIDSRPVRGFESGMKPGAMQPECSDVRRYMSKRLKTPSCEPMRS